MKLLELEKRVIIRHRSRGTQEQAVALRQHIGLVAEGDAPPALMARQLESKAHYALRRRARDNPQALHHAWDHDMLQAGVETFGVFTNDNEVDVAEWNGNAGERVHRPDAGIEFQTLAEADIDRAKTFSNRRRARPLEGHAMTSDEVKRRRGQRIAISLCRAQARLCFDPINASAGRAHHFTGRPGNFRADAVPRNQDNRGRQVAFLGVVRSFTPVSLRDRSCLVKHAEARKDETQLIRYRYVWSPISFSAFVNRPLILN